MSGRALSTVIEPRHSTTVDWRELYEYRGLLWALSIRDIKVRYKQTMLGAAWAIIQPLLMMVIFTVIFGRLAYIPSDGYPYPVFVYAGLLAWNLFSQSITGAAMSVVGAQNLVSKIYFPRLVIPFASLGSYLLDFLISCCVLLILMIAFGVTWSVNLLCLPILILVTLICASGVGAWLAALNVQYRDFRYIVPFFLQLLMYATPVIYPVSLVPDKYRWLLYLNPMSGLTEGFRSSFLGTPFPYVAFLYSCGISLVIFVSAVRYFNRVQTRFADII